MTTSSISLVHVGTAANDGTGDSIRTAFQTVNNNFSYLSNYIITTATNNSSLDASGGIRKFVANGAGTLSNVWIKLPTTAADGQELQITSLVPITSCWVYQNGQSVMWLGNGFFSSGNVTAQLTYTTTNNRWMKF
jgi:hypothetical protein